MLQILLLWVVLVSLCGNLISQIRTLFHFQVSSAREYNNVNILIVNIWSVIDFASVFFLFLYLYFLFQLSFQHKIGILYCKAGQSTEEEMYNNEMAGPAFEEFLDLLGQRVRLKGFSKYRAQLDNKSKLCF